MAKRLFYVLLFVSTFAIAAPQASIVWGSCPEADEDDVLCMDQYDITECGAEAGQDVNECSCDHHNLTWTGGECEW